MRSGRERVAREIGDDIGAAAGHAALKDSRRERSRGTKAVPKFHRNGLTSDDAKYASTMRAAAIRKKVNRLLLIREPCCGV
jgi:hypothetical protein